MSIYHAEEEAKRKKKRKMKSFSLGSGSLMVSMVVPGVPHQTGEQVEVVGYKDVPGFSRFSVLKDQLSIISRDPSQ